MENSTGTIFVGQPLENPLSLLGQYSDDEVGLDDASTEAASNLDDDKKDKSCVGEALEEGEIVDIEDHSSLKADNLNAEKDPASASVPLIAEADAGRSNMVSLDEKDYEGKIECEDHVPVTSDAKTLEGTSSTWKMVLHEDSNRYYYWNTVTGETSWVLPESLAQETALTNELESSRIESKETATGSINVSAAYGVNLDDFSESHGAGYTGEVSEVKAVYVSGALLNQSLEQSGVVGSQFLGGYSVVGAVPYEAPSLENYYLSAQISSGGGNLATGSYEGHDHSALTREQGTVDLPSHVVKNGEALLERLKLLHGSVADSIEYGWLSKYLLELEIRLSDIRCLLPYGLSMAPFWMHSERQLTRLENAINTELQKQDSEVNGLQLSAEGKDANVEVAGEAKVDANARKLFSECSATVHDADTSATLAQEAVKDKAPDGAVASVQQLSLEDSTGLLHSANKGDQEIAQAAVHGNASPNPESQSSEDVDMDIDMEVEDQMPSRKMNVDVGGHLVVESGQLVQPSAPIAGPFLAPESDVIIPPPPQEEWIPPPPPDEGIPPPPPDEGIPPPPPDEPPESLCPPPPPSDAQPVPSVYSDQNNTYTNVDYYGNPVPDVLGTSFYQLAGGGQISGLTPPAYYDAISNAQPTSVLNPADSAAYYCIQNGSLPVAPVPATVGLSNFQVASSHPNYDFSTSEQVGTVDTVGRASISLNTFVDPVVPSAKMDVVPTQALSTLVASALTTVSAKEYASVPSYSAAATSVTATSTSVVISDASVAVSKAQSQASRTKKPKVAVASSLRSNKKVSGLVDKWKAAKEELQEEEEQERETPLEILEKKRRREIEEWRAQQIASGEAKENANFQPLGGDWRERVKRRRAQKEIDAGTTSDTVDNGTKQPDLNELSKNLPSGWQAYWDDSSRQVYYANSITSETTWTKPTR